jgi:hypothetical protein
MRFANKKEEFVRAVETVALIISFGGIFLQIWVLISGLESYFKGKYENLLPSVILSGLAFLACGIGIFLTNLDFLKGMSDGRTKTYRKSNTGKAA